MIDIVINNSITGRVVTGQFEGTYEELVAKLEAIAETKVNRSPGDGPVKLVFVVIGEAT